MEALATLTTLAAGAAEVFMYILIGLSILFLVIILGLFLPILGPWIRAKAAGSSTGMFDLAVLRLRRADTSRIVAAHTETVRAGLPVPVGTMAQHDRAGGSAADPNDGAGRVGVFRGAQLVAGDQDLDSAWLVIEGDGAGDLLGIALCGPGDLNGDGTDDLLVSAVPYSTPSSTHAGGTVGWFGPALATGGVVSLADADARIRGDQSGWGSIGGQLDGLGDLDGDGLGEIVVTGPGYSADAVSSGAAWLFDGATLVAGGEIGLAQAALRWVGSDEADTALGFALSVFGDADGDGLMDLALGSFEGARADFGGAVQLFRGSTLAAHLASPPGDLVLADADAALVGSSAGLVLGYVLGPAGDVDGDGLDDLLVSSSSRDLLGERRISYYLFPSGW